MSTPYGGAAPSVVLSSGTSAYAHIFGAVDVAPPDWKPSTPIDLSAPISRYITSLPFTIGRVKPEDKSEEEFLAVESSRISREHAVIDWDSSKQQYFLVCKSKNGVDVNRKHVDINESVPLPSQSAVRMGPFYFYYCLPKRENGSKDNTAMDEIVRKPRNTYNFKPLVEQAYERFFTAFGYVSVPDLIKTLRDIAEPSALPESDDQIRKALQTLLRKPGSGWEQVEPEAVPKDVYKELCSRHARKPTSWFHKIGAEPTSLRTAADTADVPPADGMQLEEDMVPAPPSPAGAEAVDADADL